MKARLKILHTADLHLGKPYPFLNIAKQKAMQAEQERLFSQIIRIAAQEKVDFLVLAGDLFDSINPDRYLLEKVEEGFAAIPQVEIIINPGNHDYWHPHDLWQKLSSLNHVHVFAPGSSEFRFSNHAIAFHGKAFLSQSSSKSLWQADSPNLDLNLTNVLVQHGDLQASHSNYNPIQTYWIDQAKFDFALLGHIHNSDKIIYTDKRIPCLYSGCPQARDFDEAGPKGIYLLDLTDPEKPFNQQLHFLPMDGARFYNIPISLTSSQYRNVDNQFDLQDQIILQLSEILSLLDENPSLKQTKEARSLALISNQSKKAQVREAMDFLLSRLGKYDSCKLKLEGSTPYKINSELLSQRLSEIFFHVEIEDKSTMPIDFDILLNEHSLRGDVTRYAKKLAKQEDLLKQALTSIALENLNMQKAKNIIEQAYYFTMQAAEQDLDIYED